MGVDTTSRSVLMGGSGGHVTGDNVVGAARCTIGADGAGLRDPLTGLATWPLFVDGAAAALARAARNGWSTALLVIDVDQFHLVNYRLGHEPGDRVLTEVARRLVAGFRPYDTVARPGNTVARLGSDEFVILCEDVADPASARSLGCRVADLLEAPFELRDGEVLVTAGVGVTLAPPGAADVEELVVQADSAMRRAKQQGRGAHTVFPEDMAAPVGRRPGGRAAGCGRRPRGTSMNRRRPGPVAQASASQGAGLPW